MITGILLWIFDPLINFILRRVQPLITKGIASVEPQLRYLDQNILGPTLRVVLNTAYWVIRYGMLWAYPIVAPFLWILAPIFNWIVLPITKRFLLPDLSRVKKIRRTCAPWMDPLQEQTFQNSHSAIDTFTRKVQDIQAEAKILWTQSLEEKKRGEGLSQYSAASPQASPQNLKSPIVSSHNASEAAHWEAKKGSLRIPVQSKTESY